MKATTTAAFDKHVNCMLFLIKAHGEILLPSSLEVCYGNWSFQTVLHLFCSQFDSLIITRSHAPTNN